MPSRFVCVAILLYWAVAAVGLARRDLLPDFSVSAPPDLLAITVAEKDAGPSLWALQVIDDPAEPDSRRNVGQAVTETRRGLDGWADMTSLVSFDSGRLLKGTPMEHRTDDRIEFASKFRVDPTGNLQSFQAGVKTNRDQTEVLKIEGTRKAGEIEVLSVGPLPMLNRKFRFPYKDRAVVGSKFGPLDRLPGLRIGQRWEEKVANPLTGLVETVKVHVARKVLIQWNGSPVETKEVVHQSSSLSARTWVRQDGVVLRQEIPFPLLRLVLERVNEPPAVDHQGSE